MGKRELLIIVAFVVVGAVAYQFTAPPPAPGQTGFSLSGLMREFRREMRGDPGSATRTHTASLPAPASLAEVRVSGVTGRVEVQAEERADISYELRVTSNGPDDAAAAALADRTVLQLDDLGATLALSVSYPREARQRTALTLRLPKRLAARLEGGGGSEGIAVTGLRAVYLENVTGDVRVRDTGAVTGSHRNGRLEVSDVASASLTLVSSRADLKGVRGSVTLNARGGECQVTGAGGPVEVEQSNSDLQITQAASTVRVSGSNGSVVVDSPGGEVTIDVRRAEVEVIVAAAVRITARTTDEPLRLTLGDTAALELDAIATEDGKVSFDGVPVSAEGDTRTSRLARTIGAAGGARVALRNQRGEIVIRKAK